jgi:FkbM family methyltransferase
MDRFETERADSEKTRRLLGPFARAIIVSTPQGIYAVQAEDFYVGLPLRQKGEYAPNELKLLKSMCNSETRLLVVGAHIGAFAIPLAKICRGVVAIEANPESCGMLQLNVALNGLSNIRTINKAASNKAEQIEFLLSRFNTGGSKRMPVIREPAYFYDNPTIVKIDAVALDDLLPDETFDVILMDIEGSEYFALQGMPRILASAGMLHVEFIPHHLKNVAAASVADFLAVILPHFQSMFIPSKGIVLGREHCVAALQDMYDRNQDDPGLTFLKIPPDQVHTQRITPGE